MACCNLQLGKAGDAEYGWTAAIQKNPRVFLSNFLHLLLTVPSYLFLFSGLTSCKYKPALLERGKYFMTKGRKDDAKQDFEKAREVDPEDTVSRLYLAGLAMAVGDLDNVCWDVDAEGIGNKKEEGGGNEGGRT
jgi:hypothetical protein